MWFPPSNTIEPTPLLVLPLLVNAAVMVLMSPLETKTVSYKVSETRLPFFSKR
jgi:hypothetical protein